MYTYPLIVNLQYMTHVYFLLPHPEKYHTTPRNVCVVIIRLKNMVHGMFSYYHCNMYSHRTPVGKLTLFNWQLY